MEVTARNNFIKWSKVLSREELEEQLDTQKGGLIDETKKQIKATTKETEFVEFLAALQLADFYFPNEHKDICFELRRNTKPTDIKSFKDLTDNFENYTHVDCKIKNSNTEVSFQIKRDYSDHTPCGFALWLNEKVFKKYSEMSGTTLVIFLGIPTDGSPVELDKLYEEFTKKCLSHISFDKVSLIYNDNTTGHIVLHELFPEHKRLMIETDLAMARMRGQA